MRHNKKHGMKLGTDASHTKAMRRSLTCALFENDRIKTNIQRAKAIRPDVDRVITWAKKGDLHSRRLAIAQLNNPDLVSEIFEKAAQGMWADRNGGYTRIMRIGRRRGDNAEIVIIELVSERVRGAASAGDDAKDAAAKDTAGESTVSAVEEVDAAEEAAAGDAAEGAEDAEAEAVEAESADADAADADAADADGEPEAEAEETGDAEEPAEDANAEEAAE